MADRTLTVGIQVAAVSAAFLLGIFASPFLSQVLNENGDSSKPEVAQRVQTAEFGEGRELQRFRFSVGGREHTAALHVPKGIVAGVSVPLVVVFHGGKDSTARAITGNWVSMFDREAILVFPNGQRDRPDEPAWKVDDPNDLRDVELTKALVKELEGLYDVDPARRYVAGFSNGGMQTMMLMCHASEMFAGAAVVHQTLHNHLAETCQPARPMPLFYINGTADAQWSGRYFSRSAPDTFEWWSRKNGCKLRTLERLPLPDTHDDGTTVERWRFGRCDRAQVEMLRVEGGGHSWPGSDFSGDDHCLDVDATHEITEFWARHTPWEG